MPSNLLVWFQVVVTYLLHSSILLAGTWALAKANLLRNPARLAATWKAAAVIPLLTAAIHCSGDWAHETLPLDQAVTEPRRPNEHHVPVIISSPTPQELSDVEQQASPLHVSAELLEQGDNADLLGPRMQAHDNRPGATDEEPEQLLSWLCYWLMISAAVVVLLGTLRLLLQSIVFHRWISRCEPLREPSVQRLLGKLVSRTGLPYRVQLLTSASASQPIAAGVFQWIIVLPLSAHRRLGRRELEALLAHEVAHLVRRDAIWLWIGRILCSCLAFQPLNFLARRRWLQFSELCCDDWAIAHGADRAALASCLVKVARWRLEQPRVVGALSMAGTYHSFTYRVERLLKNVTCSDHDVPATARRPVRVLILAAVIGLMLCLPRLSIPVALAADRSPAAHKTVMQREHEERQPDLIKLLDQEFDELNVELEYSEQLSVERPALHSRIRVLRQRTADLAARFRFVITIDE